MDKEVEETYARLESYRKILFLANFVLPQSLIDHFANTKPPTLSTVLPENNTSNGLKNQHVSMEQQKNDTNELDAIKEFESTVVNTSVLCIPKVLSIIFMKTQKYRRIPGKK